MVLVTVLVRYIGNISGLHRTKIGANRNARLIVENDDTISHIDPNCMLVKVPLLEDIPLNFTMLSPIQNQEIQEIRERPIS